MSESGLSAGAGFVYTINIVIGAGFLSLPYAFKETGILLSLIYLSLASALNNYLSLMFLEVMHKVKLLKVWEDEGIPIQLHARDLVLKRRKLTVSEETSENTLIVEGSQMNASAAMSILFGRKFGIFYLSLLTISFEGALIAYTSIFGSSMASNVPLPGLGTCDIYTSGFYSPCVYNYWVFVLIYAIIVIYLTLRGLKEQKSFQIVMCGMRFIIMTLVIVCSLDLLVKNNPVAPGGARPDSHSPAMFNFKETGVALPVILFALGYQLQLPSIVELVADKAKNLWRIVTAVTFTSLLWYSALGAVVPYAIPNVEEQSTLSFRQYSGGNMDRTPWWAEIISFVIVLFPAFDVMSCFPMSSISLADNWISIIYGKSEAGYKKVIGLRVVICLVPLVIASFLYNIV